MLTSDVLSQLFRTLQSFFLLFVSDFLMEYLFHRCVYYYYKFNKTFQLVLLIYVAFILL